MHITKNKPQLLGSFWLAAAEAGKGLLKPRIGRIIEAPGDAAPLSIGVVAALGGAILLMIHLKKSKVV